MLYFDVLLLFKMTRGWKLKKSNKRKELQIVANPPLFLASCSGGETKTPVPPVETEPPRTQSPVIICSTPPELLSEKASKLPNSIIFIGLTRDDGRVKIQVSIFEGSELFRCNPDGSLNEVDYKNPNGERVSLVHTGVDVFLPLAKISDGQIIGVDLAGCLVDKKDKEALKQFLLPEGPIGSKTRQDYIAYRKNPFKGIRTNLVGRCLSKPSRF